MPAYKEELTEPSPTPWRVHRTGSHLGIKYGKGRGKFVIRKVVNRMSGEAYDQLLADFTHIVACVNAYSHLHGIEGVTKEPCGLPGRAAAPADAAWAEFTRLWKDTYFRDADPKDTTDCVNYAMFKMGWDAARAGQEEAGLRELAGQVHLFLLRHSEISDPERAELLERLKPYRRKFGEIVDALAPGGGDGGEDEEGRA